MHWISLILLIFLVSCESNGDFASYSSRAEGVEVGNGGGGVSIKNSYMTFGSEKLKIRELPGLEIPSALVAQELLARTPLDQESYSVLYNSLSSSSGRKYYVQNEFISNSHTQTILKEYSRITGKGMSELTLFALTDSDSLSTFLFPSFFKLTSFEQAIILLHEAAWIINPGLTYDQILSFEISAQTYYTDDTDVRKKADFFKNLFVVLNKLPLLINGVQTSFSLSLKDFVGIEALNCLADQSLECSEIFYQWLQIGYNIPDYLKLNLSLFIGHGGKVTLEKYIKESDLNDIHIDFSRESGSDKNIAFIIRDSTGQEIGKMFFKTDDTEDQFGDCIRDFFGNCHY